MRVPCPAIPSPEVMAKLRAVKEESAVSEQEIAAAITRVPPSWKMAMRLDNGAAFRRGNVQVLMSVQKYPDGRVWLHVSACVRNGPEEFGDPRLGATEARKKRLHRPRSLGVSGDLADGSPALPDFTWGTGKI